MSRTFDECQKRFAGIWAGNIPGDFDTSTRREEYDS